MVEGVEVTMIDNGMPVVVLRASDMGVTGQETPRGAGCGTRLKARLEAIRLACGPMMNLGDVTNKTVPKMTMVSAPRAGGAISTRTLHSAPLPRLHRGLGCGERGDGVPAARQSPPQRWLIVPGGVGKTMPIEHPIGETTIIARDWTVTGPWPPPRSFARRAKLMDGVVYAD
jgi:4-oxalomesaconate tautomerase